jgi:hypothetical protein
VTILVWRRKVETTAMMPVPVLETQLMIKWVARMPAQCLMWEK